MPPEPLLMIWVIYYHPKDFPDKFVARRFNLDQPTPDHITSDSLEGIRSALLEKEPGLVCLTRAPEDDPVILETWI